MFKYILNISLMVLYVFLNGLTLQIRIHNVILLLQMTHSKQKNTQCFIILATSLASIEREKY